jgi:environmental stress-induced protein Ves
MRIVRYAELPEIPWSNGLGVTREIARSSEKLDSAAYDWRISIARIDGDAPFSRLPGIDRSLMALGNDGVTLVVGDGDPQHLALHEILRFDGEDDVRPVGVAAPNFDLNLMTRRDTASGYLSRVTVTGETTVGTPAGETSAAVLLDGELTVKIDRYRRCRLQLFDAVIATGGDMLLWGTAVIALVQVR